ncbi:hypothetical protein WME73_40615 [Sorangium sp. So ce302]
MAAEVARARVEPAPVVLERPRDELGRERGEHAHRDVDALLDQIGEPIAAAEIHGDARVLGLEARAERGDAARAVDRGRRDAQRTAHRLVARGDVALERLDVGEELPAARDVRFAEIGQRVPARRALHELHAEPSLGVGDGLAHRRGRETQPLGRRGERAQIRDRHQEPQGVRGLGRVDR